MRMRMRMRVELNSVSEVRGEGGGGGELGVGRRGGGLREKEVGESEHALWNGEERMGVQKEYKNGWCGAFTKQAQMHCMSRQISMSCSAVWRSTAHDVEREKRATDTATSGSSGTLQTIMGELQRYWTVTALQ